MVTFLHSHLEPYLFRDDLSQNRDACFLFLLLFYLFWHLTHCKCTVWIPACFSHQKGSFKAGSCAIIMLNPHHTFFTVFFPPRHIWGTSSSHQYLCLITRIILGGDGKVVSPWTKDKGIESETEVRGHKIWQCPEGDSEGDEAIQSLA